MVVKFRNNFSLLVFIHLFLLAYPLVSKIIHEHHGQQISYKFSTQASFNQDTEFCAVCDFEFYSFIAATQISTSINLKIIPVYNSPAPIIHFVQFIEYFSLRAPPVA